MRLIVDTNIIISALIKGGTVRTLIFNPYLELYTPEFVLEEIEDHMDMIEERSGLSEEEIFLTLSLISAHIKVIPKEDFSHKINEGEKVIGSIDEDDVPFIALAFRQLLVGS